MIPQRGRLLPLLALAFLAFLGFGLFATRTRNGAIPPTSARTLVNTMEKQVAIHLENQQERTALYIARSALVRPEVQWVVIQDVDGQVIAEAVQDGLDPAAIRAEIVRAAWKPTSESWATFQLPDQETSHNLSRPLWRGKQGSPNQSTGIRRLGTIHVGFDPRSSFGPLDRLVAAGSSVATRWTSPLRRDLTTRSRQALVYYRDGIRANRKFYESEARTAWMMAVEEDPHFAMAMVRLGELAHQLNDDPDAMSWLCRAEAEMDLVTEKERLEIRRLRADLDGREGDERRIENELIHRFKSDAEVLVLSGNQHLNEGRPAVALANLREALRLDPELPEALNLIGYAESELGHWHGAEEAFEKYTFLNRHQANPHDSLGEHYLRTGRYRKALDQFEMALEMKPDFAWAHYHLALVNAELGRWDAAIFAIQAARESSRHAPEDRAWSRTEIMLQLRAGQVAEASRLLVMHGAEFPQKPVDSSLAIRVALAKRDLSAARAGLSDLEAAVQASKQVEGKYPRQNPDHSMLLEMRGLIESAEGRPDKGVEFLDAAMTAANSWEARLRIERESIEVLVESGRREEGLRRLDIILARNPDDPIANWWFGRALDLDGRHGEARTAFERSNQVLNGAHLEG